MKQRKLIWAILVGMVFTGNSFAATSPPNPTPVPGTEGKPTVVVEQPRSGSMPETKVVNQAIAAVRKASASSEARVNLTLLSNMSAKAMPKSERKRCWTDSNGFWNTGRTASGGLRNFWDTRPSLICISKKDGKMYRVACRNLVFSTPQFKVVTGVVLLVQSFGKFKHTIKDSSSVTVKDWCGSAKASAFASATVSGRTRQEARGNARFLWAFRLAGKVWTKATAQINCGPQAPAPGAKFTTLAFVKEVYSVSGQRISSGESFLVTVHVPGSGPLHVNVPGSGQKVVLRDNAGQAFQFGANARIVACEDESVTARYHIVGARCYEVVTNTSGGEVVFTFKNQAKPTAPPPCTVNCNPPPPGCVNCPPANRPPTIDIVNPPQHVFVNGQIQVTVVVNDPDGDQVSVRCDAVRGTVSTMRNEGSGRWTGTYTAPSAHGKDRISCTVSDGTLSDSDSTPEFDVVADDF